MGIAVDQATGLVYITTGYSADNIKIYDSTLNMLWESSKIGDTTGLCIPGKDIAYNPLNFRIESIIGDRPVTTNDTITYRYSFYNPTDST